AGTRVFWAKCFQEAIGSTAIAIVVPRYSGYFFSVSIVVRSRVNGVASHF
ncbi:MAG: hypothetical protein H6Q07_209, partial [Acidobacteria bacterium]|nr:hypothetical protein [Acidobacteriota bacterium]